MSSRDKSRARPIVKTPVVQSEMSDLPLAKEQAEAAVMGLSHMLNRLAEKVGGRADVRAVFGEPLSQGGVTVIPVASVLGGFGAGAGLGDGEQADQTEVGAAKSQGGFGGGGGFFAMPLGFIEIESGRAHFRRLDGAEASVGARGGLAGVALGLAVQGVRFGIELWRRRRAEKAGDT